MVPARGIVGEIVDNLGHLFRHLLPGILIVGTTRITHPTWFAPFKVDSWQYVVVIGAIAVAVGNAWFSLNRYVLHQVVDLVCWFLKFEGPAKKNGNGYIDDLALYVREALTESEMIPDRARQHVSFRASVVLLIYTVWELTLLASLWHEKATIVDGCQARIILISASAILFIAGLWQNIITRRIDAAVLHKNLVDAK